MRLISAFILAILTIAPALVFGQQREPLESMQIRKMNPQLIAELTRKCNLGDSKSCESLGAAYYSGTIVGQDLKKSRAAYEKACDLGNVGACVDRGLRMVNGEGVPKDEEAGFTLLEKACRYGNRHGCEMASQVAASMGTRSMADGRFARAYELLDFACEHREDQACGSLAKLQMQRSGGDKDTGAALENARRGCKANSPTGCEVQAVMYMRGIGVGQNSAEALRHFERACELKLGSSCIGAIEMLPKDPVSGRPSDLSKVRKLAADACFAGETRGCGLAADLLLTKEAGPINIYDAASMSQLACSGSDQRGCRVKAQLEKLCAGKSGHPCDEVNKRLAGEGR